MILTGNSSFLPGSILLFPSSKRRWWLSPIPFRASYPSPSTNFVKVLWSLLLHRRDLELSDLLPVELQEGHVVRGAPAEEDGAVQIEGGPGFLGNLRGEEAGA